MDLIWFLKLVNKSEFEVVEMSEISWNGDDAYMQWTIPANLILKLLGKVKCLELWFTSRYKVLNFLLSIYLS